MINNLPDKFDTLISENVSKLSGGEKQKISIIRILLKNVPILIFDEPTSALDFSSIDVFKQVICDIKQNKIIFIISHDKQVIEIADEIINL
jgi:ATP-binding cassette subfamily C protein